MRHPRPWAVLGSLIFDTDVRMWYEHPEVIREIARRNFRQLTWPWPWLAALSGWNEDRKDARFRRLLGVLAVALALYLVLRGVSS